MCVGGVLVSPSPLWKCHGSLHGSFCRNSHLNFQTALTSTKFSSSASPLSQLTHGAQTENTQYREKQLQPRPIMVLNYQAKGAQRKTHRVRHTHRDAETERQWRESMQFWYNANPNSPWMNRCGLTSGKKSLVTAQNQTMI